LNRATGEIPNKARNDRQLALPLQGLQWLDLIDEGSAGLLLPGFDGSRSFVRFSFIANRGVRAEAARKLRCIATIADCKVRLHDVGKLKGHLPISWMNVLEQSCCLTDSLFNWDKPL
jgi:hypothetical protein